MCQVASVLKHSNILSLWSAVFISRRQLEERNKRPRAASLTSMLLKVKQSPRELLNQIIICKFVLRKTASPGELHDKCSRWSNSLRG